MSMCWQADNAMKSKLTPQSAQKLSDNIERLSNDQVMISPDLKHTSCLLHTASLASKSDSLCLNMYVAKIWTPVWNMATFNTVKYGHFQPTVKPGEVHKQREQPELQQLGCNERFHGNSDWGRYWQPRSSSKLWLQRQVQGRILGKTIWLQIIWPKIIWFKIIWLKMIWL